MLSQATAGIIGFRALWAGGGRNRLKNPEIISPKKSSKTDILRIQIMEVWLEDDVSFSIPGDFQVVYSGRYFFSSFGRRPVRANDRC